MPDTVPPAPRPPNDGTDGFGIRRIGNTGGVAGGLVQSGFTINSDTRGLLEGTAILIYEVSPSLPKLPSIPRRGSPHPTDARLKCYKVDASFSGNGECRVTASYIGLEKDPTDSQVEITGSTSETSIVFHPGFAKMAIKKAGKPAGNGAKAVLPEYYDYIDTDDAGNFQKFAVGAAPADMGGVEAYLTPKATVRCTYYTGSTTTVKSRQSGLGLASPTPGGFPKSLIPSTKANWLLTSVGVSEYGNVYKISEEWMMSESGKPWNPNIYSGGDTGGPSNNAPLNGSLALGGQSLQGNWTGVSWGPLKGING